jgi:hypothetical protein
MNEKIPKSFTWTEYKKLDSEMGVFENFSAPLLFEPWLYRYFHQFDMFGDSVFLPSTWEYIYLNNVICSGDSLRMYVSETSTGHIIIFVCRDVEIKSSLENKRYKIINRNSGKIIGEGEIFPGYCLWYTVFKEDMIIDLYVDGMVVDSFTVTQKDTIRNTIFLFNRNDVKCVSYTDRWIKEGFDFLYM